MAALAEGRNTPRKDGLLHPYKVKAATKCYAGGIAVSDAGYAKPAATAAGLHLIGVFEEDADNSSGSDGGISVMVRRHGAFKFENDANDPVGQAHVGTNAWLIDDQTVAATSSGNTRSKAGRVVQVDSDGVWVDLVLS